MTAVPYAAGKTPASLTVSDLNGDGALDVAVADGGSGEVNVLLGDGLGGLQPALVFPVGGTPAFVLAANLDGDTRKDLALGDGSSGTIYVLLNATP
jgi:hypothetical protein